MKNLLLLLIFISSSILAQSSIINTSFYSSSLDRQRGIQILLPPGYSSEDTIEYPVIYFLHGILNNHLGYSQIINVVNNLYETSTFSKYIIVKPDGSTGPYLGSFYTNSELYGNFEDYIINDVIDYVEANYKTKTGKENRFIAGHSMGGYGAMKLGIKYPDMFRGVVSHSGPLDFNNFHAQLPYILQENGGVPPYNYAPENGVFTIVFYTMAGAFSPDISKPDSVELPLDVNGNFIPSVMLKWMLHNPSGLVKTLDPLNFPAVYFDCGTFDELKLYEHNTGFRDTLELMGFPFRFESYAGLHGNMLPERLNISLLFIDSVYKSTVSYADDLNVVSLEYSLFQNYPNPFNPSTEIKAEMPRAGHLSLKVYDLLGREVVTLVDENLNAGIHTYTFDGSKLSNGIYFCRMESAGYSAVIKMIMLK